MTDRITFKTAAPITMTVSQMLTVSIALCEAADWNRKNGYPQQALEIYELRAGLREQFKPYFDAIDDAAAGVQAELPLSQ